MEMRGNYLYADSYKDLLVFDLSDLTNVDLLQNPNQRSQGERPRKIKCQYSRTDQKTIERERKEQEHEYGGEMVSSFSNYGKENVDVFAPCVDFKSFILKRIFWFRYLLW